MIIKYVSLNYQSEGYPTALNLVLNTTLINFLQTSHYSLLLLGHSSCYTSYSFLHRVDLDFAMHWSYFLASLGCIVRNYQEDVITSTLVSTIVNPTYSTGQVILPELFGFLLRIKSFNELNFMIKNHEFSKLFPRGTKLSKATKKPIHNTTRNGKAFIERTISAEVSS